MTERNGELLKSFSRLDKLLNERYGRQEGKGGVTVYLDRMKETENDAAVRDIKNWNDDFRRLQRLRHIRNQLAHEWDAMDTDMCEKEDILWLERFCKRVLGAEDPIAELIRIKEQNRHYKGTKKSARKQRNNKVSDLSEHRGLSKNSDAENGPRDFLVWFILLAVFVLLIFRFVNG